MKLRAFIRRLKEIEGVRGDVKIMCDQCAYTILSKLSTKKEERNESNTDREKV